MCPRSGRKAIAMPHATVARDAQEEQDELLIQQALDPENPLDFNRDLELGEKAEDAVNFSDLSDDDLADDEIEGGSLQSTYAAHLPDGHEPPNGRRLLLQNDHLQTQGYADDVRGDVLDDLFGERSSSPADGVTASEDTGHPLRLAQLTTSIDSNDAFGSDSDRRTPAFTNPPQKHTAGNDAYQGSSSSLRIGQEDDSLSKEQQLQQELFAMSGSSLGRIDVVPIIETQEDLLAALWPRFERDTVPKFMDLLPPKKARYIGKTPVRRPKALQPTRLSLEIAMDQEKGFRLASGSNKRFQENVEQQRLITIQKEPSEGEREDDDQDQESDVENDRVGEVSWQDLQIICGDWHFEDSLDPSSPGALELPSPDQDDTFADFMESISSQSQLPAAKVYS